MRGELDQALREIVREVIGDAIRDHLLPALAEDRPADGDRLLSLSDAQEILAAGWDTIDRLLRDGELEAVQVRGRRKVTASSIQGYIDRHRDTGRSVRAVS